MASSLGELSCPVCHEIFTDPVLLSCSHSFCKQCVRSWWSRSELQDCPVCKRRSSRTNPPLNLVLKNLCEAVMKERSGNVDLCSVHSEKLKLFCLDHQQPVCVVCRDSKAHTDHCFSPIEEAALDLKQELEKTLERLEEKLILLQICRENCDLGLAHIKDQRHKTERQIQEQFKELYRFLLEEEEVRMKAVREEEEQKTQRMKDKMAAVSREIDALTQTITETQKQLKNEDISFLVQYKDTVERVERCQLLEEPQLQPGALMDQAKHVGNLGFNIWTNMKKEVKYMPVILDPNTAGSRLCMSEDLTSLTKGETQIFPKNPERIKKDYSVVRALEGYSSGFHSWEVEVGENLTWMVGVVTESGYFMIDNENYSQAGWWSFGLNLIQYKVIDAAKGDARVLKLKSNPRRIRLHLECDRHKLILYDAETNARIHIFYYLYKEKLFPFFGGNTITPISILPQKIKCSMSY